MTPPRVLPAKPEDEKEAREKARILIETVANLLLDRPNMASPLIAECYRHAWEAFRAARREGAEQERALAVQDVCMYCGGRAPQYQREPWGPNLAGNWEHQRIEDWRVVPDRGVLCVASSVWARARWQR